MTDHLATIRRTLVHVPVHISGDDSGSLRQDAYAACDALEAERQWLLDEAKRLTAEREDAYVKIAALEAERLTPEEARLILSLRPKTDMGRVLRAKLERIAGD